jgi:hypothetical protein
MTEFRETIIYINNINKENKLDKNIIKLTKLKNNIITKLTTDINSNIELNINTYDLIKQDNFKSYNIDNNLTIYIPFSYNEENEDSRPFIFKFTKLDPVDTKITEIQTELENSVTTTASKTIEFLENYLKDNKIESKDIKYIISNIQKKIEKSNQPVPPEPETVIYYYEKEKDDLKNYKKIEKKTNITSDIQKLFNIISLYNGITLEKTDKDIYDIFIKNKKNIEELISQEKEISFGYINTTIELMKMIDFSEKKGGGAISKRFLKENLTTMNGGENPSENIPKINTEENIEFIQNIIKKLENIENSEKISNRISTIYNKYKLFDNQINENFADFSFGLVQISKFNYEEDTIENNILKKKLEFNIVKGQQKYLNNKGIGLQLEDLNKNIKEIFIEFENFRKERETIKNNFDTIDYIRIKKDIIPNYYSISQKENINKKLTNLKEEFLKEDIKDLDQIFQFIQELKSHIESNYNIFNKAILTYNEQQKQTKNNQQNQQNERNYKKSKEEIEKEEKNKLIQNIKTIIDANIIYLVDPTNLNDPIDENKKIFEKYEKDIKDYENNKNTKELGEIEVNIRKLIEINFEIKKKKDKKKEQDDEKETLQENERKKLQKDDEKKENILKELINFLKTDILRMLKKGKDIQNIYGNDKKMSEIPDLYEQVYSEFIEEKNNLINDKDYTKNFIKLQNNFVKKVEILGLNPEDTLKIELNDKLIFVILIVMLKVLTLSIIDYLIDMKIIKNISISITFYTIIYTLLLLGFIVIVNIFGIKMKLFFGYFNTDINSNMLVIHISMLLFFTLIIYILSLTFDTITVNENSDTIDEDIIKLSYRIETIVNIILLFTLSLVFIL